MFCKNCGTQINDGFEFCGNCGTSASAAQAVPVAYAQQAPVAAPAGTKSKTVAGLLGILLGGLGAHKFYLGYTTQGIIQLILSLVTFGIGGILGLVEGILYLTKSDADFENTYVQGKKAWF